MFSINITTCRAIGQLTLDKFSTFTRINILIFHLFLIVICCSSKVKAAEFSIISTKDNTIFSEPVIPGISSELSNGDGDYFFAGKIRPDGFGHLRRGLLFFDVAGSISSGAKVKSVVLTLNMSRRPGMGTEPTTSNNIISLHRVLTDWGEGSSHAFDEEGKGDSATPGDATWQRPNFPGAPWTTEGGDFIEEASVEKSIGDVGIYTWSSSTKMVEDVQDWLDNPSTNFGWILIGDEANIGSAKRFDSKDNSTTIQKPMLTVITRECNILNLSAVNARTCSSGSGTYTQDILVNYIDPPEQGGFLIINDQEFDITGSPQTVTLADLPLDGEIVDVTALFSAESECSLFSPALFTAPDSCDCSILSVTPAFGAFCDPETNTYTKRLTVKAEFPPESGTIDINEQSFAIPTEDGEKLDDPGGADFVLENLIANGVPVNVTIEFSDDPNCSIEVPSAFTSPAPCGCSFIDIIPGDQSACDPNTNLFSQTLTIQYAGAPSTGNLIVNGQVFSFNPAAEHQEVTLVDLPANGDKVNVTASFSDQPTCTITKNELFTAPPPCPPCDIVSITANDQSPCNSITQTYSQDVTIQFSNDPGPGILEVNGQTFAIDSSTPVVTLTNLPADSSTVDVTASFSGASQCEKTMMNVFTAPEPCPCAITSITLGNQAACDPITNTFSQSLTINYRHPPPTGMFEVNGQSFPFESQSATIELLHLNANANEVPVSAQFSALPSCSLSPNLSFTAPDPCPFCKIVDIQSGALQSVCQPESNTFSQEITVIYTDLMNLETLNVNGQSFETTSSPQTVTLEGLTADEKQADVTAWFPGTEILNQDFQDGELNGWDGSNSNPPAIIADGGPEGVGDQFLRVIADGVGSGGRLVTFNSVVWIGNFHDQGIQGIAVDLNNLGMNELEIRLLLRGNSANETSFVSQKSVTLKSNNEWKTVVFPIEPSDWEKVSTGTSTIEEALSDVTEFRILHNPEITLTPPFIQASLGIDNIKGLCSFTRRQVYTAPPDCTPMISLVPGWNLIALPVQPAPPNDTVDALFSEVSLSSPVWGWNGSKFEAVTRLKALNGYWINSTVALDKVISGIRPKILADNIKAGWNLIGVGTDNFSLQPNNTIHQSIWGWNGGRLQPDTILELMNGYWLYSSDVATINLSE